MPDLSKQSPFLIQTWKRQNHWWRYMLVFLITIFLAGAVPVLVMTFISFRNMAEEPLLLYGPKIIGILSYGPILWLSIYLLHKVPPWTIGLTKPAVRWKRLSLGFGVGIAASIIALVLECIIFQTPLEYVSSNLSGLAVSLFLVALTTFTVITTSLFSVGYILPGFIRWLKIPALAFLLWLLFSSPSFLYSFFLSIPNNQAPLADGLNLLLLIVFSIWLYMDDGFELAAGWLFASKLFTLFFVSKQSEATWGGDKLFHFDFALSDFGITNLLIADNLLSIIFITLATFFFAKRLNWSNWRERLIKPYHISIVSDELVNKIDEIGSHDE
ncbi:MAG: hypothetical protein AB8F95_22835 [Bacteroidia bacterium]